MTENQLSKLFPHVPIALLEQVYFGVVEEMSLSPNPNFDELFNVTKERVKALTGEEPCILKTPDSTDPDPGFQNAFFSDSSLVVDFNILRSRCSYCGLTQDGRISFGVTALRLSCEDYMVLVNRGWTRSGRDIYRPLNDISCCPQEGTHHSISGLSKCSTRARLKSWLECGHFNELNDGTVAAVEKPNISPALDELKKNVYQDVLSAIALAQKQSLIPLVAVPAITLHQNADHLIPSRGHFSCAVALALADISKKLVTTQVSAEKVAKIICELLPGTKPYSATCSTSGHINITAIGLPSDQNKHNAKAVHATPPKTFCHSFDFRLVSHEFSSEVFQYSLVVHKKDVTEPGYRSFLCESPLVNEAPSDRYPLGLGSFHAHLLVDGKVVGVSVIDILPEALLSVYFFYDPDFAFLSLGKISVFHEIDLAKISNVPHYHMMNYKRHWHPSELLTESYNWVPIEPCLPMLDSNKHCRLAHADEHEPDFDKAHSLANVPLASSEGFIGTYSALGGVETLWAPEHRDAMKKLFDQWVLLAGPEAAAHILIKIV